MSPNAAFKKKILSNLNIFQKMLDKIMCMIYNEDEPRKKGYTKGGTMSMIGCRVYKIGEARPLKLVSTQRCNGKLQFISQRA